MVGRARSLDIIPKPEKCCPVVKPEMEGCAKEMFAGTGINITTEGRKHLGARAEFTVLS